MTTPRTRCRIGRKRPKTVPATSKNGCATWRSAASIWRKICATQPARRWSRCGRLSIADKDGNVIPRFAQDDMCRVPFLVEDGGEKPSYPLQHGRGSRRRWSLGCEVGFEASQPGWRFHHRKCRGLVRRSRWCCVFLAAEDEWRFHLDMNFIRLRRREGLDFGSAGKRPRRVVAGLCASLRWGA